MGTVTELSASSGPRRKRGIAANTAMNAVAQFASIISTLVFFPLLVRAFGPSVYGVYVIAISTIGLTAMFDFGIGVSTVRLVASRVSLDDARGFATVISSALGLLALLGLVVAAAIAGIALAAQDLFSVSASEATLLRTLLLIGAGMQLWYWPSTLATNVLAGLERYDVVARTSVIGTCLNVGAIAVVLLAGLGPVALLLMSAGTMVLTTVINSLAVLRARPAGPLVLPPAPPVASEIVAGGMPVFVASLAQFFNREQVDRLVLGVVLGPGAVVVYEVAAKLSMLVAQITTLPTSALLPVASALAARHDDEAVRSLFLRGSRYISLLVAPLLAVLFVLAGPFISVWFGSGYETSATIARLLILAQILVPLYQMGDPILIGAGRFSLWARRGIVLALFNLVLSVILVRVVGITGVAWGTFIAGMLEMPLYAQVILGHTGLRFGAWMRAAAPAYAVLPVAVLAAAAIALTPAADSFLGLFAAGAVAALVYWACAYAFVLDAEERSGALSRLTALVRRGGAAS